MAGLEREAEATGVESPRDEFVRLYPRLRRFAQVVADADVDANDLVHDALVAVLRQHGDRPIDDLEQYLRQAVLNRMRTLRRHAGRRRHLQAVADRSRSAPAAPSYPSDVAALLDSLGAAERAVLYLLDVERRPVAEVAALVGDSETAVRSRASRARRKLRRHLEEA